jgi:general secretion pathway protein D
MTLTLMKRFAPLLIAGSMVAAPVAAQRGRQTRPVTATPVTPVDTSIVKRLGTGFVVNFDDQPLRVVFSALAEASGLNVVQTNIPLRNTTLHMGQPVSREQMLDVIKGLAASNSVSVIEGASLVRLEGPAPQQQLSQQQFAQQQAQQAQQQLFIYRLKHASAVQLAPVLQSLFSGAGRTVTTNGPTNPLATLLGIGGQQQTVTFTPGAAVADNATFGRAGNGGGGNAGGANAGAGNAGVGNAGAGNAGAGNFGGGRGGGRGAVLQQLAQAQNSLALSSAAADIRIQAEESSNSLLIRATQPDYAIIQQVLGGVDLRPLQVLIEVTIAEVTRTHDLNVGISGNAKNTPKSAKGTTASGTQQTAATDRDFLLELTGGKGGVQFDVALNALQSRGDVRVLSLPVIIAENNRQAVLNVGSSRPFVQVSQSAIGVTGGVVQTIQYIDVGTVLTITPTINPDGYVNLQVTQTDNSATNEIQFDAPVINKREATTQVFIRDGQTTVIGGLADNSDSRTVSGIPVLSRIPGLGWLFGNKQADKETNELFLFLTPHVIFTYTDVDKLRDAVKDQSELLQSVNTGARIVPKADTLPPPLKPDSGKAKPDTVKKKPPTR